MDSQALPPPIWLRLGLKTLLHSLYWRLSSAFACPFGTDLDRQEGSGCSGKERDVGQCPTQQMVPLHLKSSFEVYREWGMSLCELY